MKFRKVKKEDVKVGAVIYFPFENNYTGYEISEIKDGYVIFDGFEMLGRCYTIDTIEGLYMKDNSGYCEETSGEDLKEHGGKVMTYNHKKPLPRMTYGKNYNVKKQLGNTYSCIDDAGIERFFLMSAFKESLESTKVEYAKNGDIIPTFESLRTGGKPLILLGENTGSGTKHDSNKLKPTLLINDMPLAINELLKVLKFGAEKYGEGNWLKVENGINRYRNAGLRHLLASEELDDESGLSHLSHAITSLLMELELRLREENAK